MAPERQPDPENGRGLLTDEVIQDNHLKLIKSAFIRLRNLDAAEDMVQTTWLKAFRKIDQMRGESQIGTWLHAILFNSIRDRYDYLKVRREGPLEDNITDDRIIGVEDQIILREEQDELLNNAGLSDNERAALSLWSKGYKDYEISEMLDKPLGTIKSHISRARKKLRNLRSNTEN